MYVDEKHLEDQTITKKSILIILKIKIISHY